MAPQPEAVLSGLGSVCTGIRVCSREIMATAVPTTYFQELAYKSPQEVCRLAQCTYDAASRAYSLRVWGEEYTVHPHELRVDRTASTGRNPHPYFPLFVVYYLLRAKEIETQNEWITEKDIPGGPTFFRGPHEIPTNIVTGAYANNIALFRKRCEQLQGAQLQMADAAYAFSITPRIPTAVLYWRGDDEFSPQARILYDRTITEHLASDIVFVLAVEICTRIGYIGGGTPPAV